MGRSNINYAIFTSSEQARLDAVRAEGLQAPGTRRPVGETGDGRRNNRPSANSLTRSLDAQQEGGVDVHLDLDDGRRRSYGISYEEKQARLQEKWNGRRVIDIPDVLIYTMNHYQDDLKAQRDVQLAAILNRHEHYAALSSQRLACQQCSCTSLTVDANARGQALNLWTSQGCVEGFRLPRYICDTCGTARAVYVSPMALGCFPLTPEPGLENSWFTYSLLREAFEALVLGTTIDGEMLAAAGLLASCTAL
jgi:hypothetical protein